MKSASLSVHHFALITQKLTSINLKFGGKVFHGVQTDSSKFGLICLKIKGESFSHFNWEYTVKLLLFITYVKINILLSDDVITSELTM